jgi:hypothetical protein
MVELAPITDFKLTDHARDEMVRRQITEADVAQVLASPGQTETLRAGRAVYQSRVEMGDPPRVYLLRVIVDTDRQPVEVVTAYRTSKIEKYWRAAA